MERTQVACHGPGPDANTVCTILDVVKGYSPLKGLILTDCLLGERGLEAVTSLLQRGCGKWWTGPKLTLLELTFEAAMISSGIRPSVSSALGLKWTHALGSFDLYTVCM